jgi:uncharacterized membrane protein YdjX (TVP38/TMEM64 family)
MVEALLNLARDWSALGGLGLAFLAGTFALGALIFVPRTALCLVAGFVFGFSAFPVALVASTVGATVALMISRFLFRPAFLEAIAARPRLHGIAQAIDAEGWRIIALMRLASPFPGTGLNYLVGVTRIGVWPFTWATVLGSVIPVSSFIYLGAISQEILDSESISHAQIAFVVLGIANLAIVTWLVARRVKQAIPATALARTDSARSRASGNPV